ncbi:MULTISPECIES: MFS transporter [Pseudomonas syringae group]|uniref:Major facilitator superfamil permease n=2 Tax=Pseudomonas syringae group TaxID=136849 RepID=A0A0P9N0Q7_PSESX|nr:MULTISPECIES: MFS transporter [Pseudomonas syringae group]KPW98490.1 Major facilitator superfamil permease [Pseudomonas syringae pv. castaneae]KWS93165.1 hypothetical protein AL048_26250 [Pseudomonas syringae pv. castaneae]RMS92123.1 Major facilitator superfamil permease [Pseudomonas savastanoi]
MRASRDRQRITRFFLISAFFLMAVQCAIEPFLAFFLLRLPNVNGLAVILIVSFQPLGALLSGVVGGAMSDRFGRKLISNIGICGVSMVFFILYLVSVNWSDADFYPYFVASALFLSGVCFSLYWPVSQAQLADFLPIEERHSAFRKRYVAINIGAALGPLAALYTGFAASKAMFLVASIVYIVYLLVQLVLARCMTRLDVPVSAEKKSMTNVTQVLTDTKLVYTLFGVIFFLMTYSQLETNIALLIRNLFSVDSLAFYTQFVSLNAISIFLLQPLSSFLERRLSKQITLIAGGCVSLLAYGLLGSVETSKYILFLFVALLSLAEVLIIPTAAAYVDSLAPPNMRGTYLGLMTLKRIGNVTGPAIGAFVIAKGGAIAFSLAMAVFCLLSILSFKLSGEKREYTNYS